MIALLLFALLAGAAQPPTNAQPDTAKRAELRTKTRAQLETIAAGLDGVMGFVIVDLVSGEQMERLPDEVFPLASTVKLAILYELFKQAEAGQLNLDEVRALDTRHVVGGSGVLLELTAPAMSLRDYATLMVVVSDNTATNLLIDTLGMANVTRRMSELGLKSLQLRRKMIDLAAAERGDENVGTANDLARLLTRIYRSEGLTRASSDAIIAILRKPKPSAMRDGVPGAVPVANKTGTLDGVEADAGIVYLAGRPYVFVALTTFVRSNGDGANAIRAASKTTFAYFDRLAKSSDYGRRIK
ncbi:MAG: class A beta-lactamase-related serine hydrolase [Acidobacteriota bacterium]|nr:serine hydrolase [Acidobacteriota bacterium]MDQ3418142.1 class A beta-lactamase-related serine hydrolase [Acidobacteriota bacterium]